MTEFYSGSAHSVNKSTFIHRFTFARSQPIFVANKYIYPNCPIASCYCPLREPCHPNTRSPRTPSTAPNPAAPITPESRLVSSRNALVHGLLSEAIVLDGESAERFSELHDSLITEFQPETPTERGLVETMVVCRWRLMRIWILENSAVSHEIRRQSGVNELENKPTQAALAYRNLSDGTRWLDGFNRYETRYDRQLSRAIQRFHDVRARRKKQKKEKVILPNEPNSGNPM